MKCLNCATEMDQHLRHGVQIEHCPACGGVWLDRGELAHLLEAARPAVTLPDPEPARPEVAKAPRPDESHGARYTAAKPRKAERFEDRGRETTPRPGDSRRYRGAYSGKIRLKDVLEEIFDFD